MKFVSNRPTEKLTSAGDGLNSYDSLQKMAINLAINRRRNTRIRYPTIGPVGGLPHIFFGQEELQVCDISLGGTCIADPLGVLGDNAGSDILLSLQWSDYSCQLPATLVGVNLDRRHIQFKNPNVEVFVRLNVLIRAGYIGEKFRRVRTFNPRISIGAEELWLGPTGESLIFISERTSPQLVAEISLFLTTVQIFRDSVPVYKDRGDNHKPGQRVHTPLLNDILVCLANIKNPSPRIAEVISLLAVLVPRQDASQ